MIILFIVGTIISAFSSIFRCGGCYNTIIGFPISFYEEIIWPREMERTDFSISNLTINVVFFYLLSCLIVWIYDKFRKKK